MIFAFTGKMGSGKTTVCDYMVKNHGFVKVGFKDAIIAEMKQNFGLLLEELATHYDMTIDELFITKPTLMRKLMQCYGTEVRRKDNPDYWIEQWKNSVIRAGGHLNIVIDDARFLNEAVAVREMGGKVIRIIRTDITETGTHQSEVEMDSIIPDMSIEVGKGEHEKLYGYVENLLSLQAV